MNEKAYKAMGLAGAAGIAVGIVVRSGIEGTNQPSTVSRRSTFDAYGSSTGVSL